MALSQSSRPEDAFDVVGLVGLAVQSQLPHWSHQSHQSQMSHCFPSCPITPGAPHKNTSKSASAQDKTNANARKSAKRWAEAGPQLYIKPSQGRNKNNTLKSA